MSLSARIVLGLLMGVFAGLFMGEPAAQLQPLADIYIRLMQMMVLPYLVTALIIALGSLSAAEARRLARYGGILLLVVWTVMALVITITPATFPAFQSASFFSHSLVEPSQPFSLPELFFSANPFESLSRAVVPAVVLFSVLIGISLIGLEDKEKLLAPLRAWNAAVVRVTNCIIELTPIGVFAIGAVAAGTMTPDTFVRLEVYLVAFVALSLLLAFWVLPLAVTAVTPFRYTEVVGIAKGALLTAFLTNNAFIVLPIIVTQSRELLQRHGLLDRDTGSATEAIVPVLFNFPHAGKLLTLLFVPFAAWLSGTPLLSGDYGLLFGAGIPSYFAKAQVALPFLLDLFALPHDLFQLYIPTTIVTGKFDSLVTAMNLLAFGLIGAAAMGGFVTLDGGRLARTALAIAGGSLAALLLVRGILLVALNTNYTLDDTVQHMHLAGADARVLVRSDAAPPETDLANLSPLERVRTRGSIRFGFDPDNLPFSFFNDEGKLVGYDVQLAVSLAADLGLEAEFVPISWPELPRLLETGTVDVMPGVWYRPYWFPSMRLTSPYMEGTMGLAMRDERRHEFASVADLRRSRGLRIGVPLDRDQVKFSMARYFGGSDTEFVVMDFWKPFFEGGQPDVDAFLMPVENASGWTLLHPEYTVVVPQPNPVRIPYAFGAPPHAGELIAVIDEWIIAARSTGEIDEAYSYWILGEGVRQQSRRWSIMHDVLGWGD
jgi:Na+/H+-dicarboxylate symporter